MVASPGRAGLASPTAAINRCRPRWAGWPYALGDSVFLALTETLSERGVITTARCCRGAALPRRCCFAFTPTFWSQALIAEVYTLHVVLMAAILWLALLWRKDQRASSPDRVSPLLWALALIVGFSLAHHRTTVLAIPVLVVFLWAVAGGRYWRNHWRAGLGAAGLLLLPLLLYLYVPLPRPAQPVADAGLAAGPIAGFAGPVAGRPGELPAGTRLRRELHGLQHTLTQAAALPGRLGGELTWFGVTLAAAGALILAARRRWSVLWLTGRRPSWPSPRSICSTPSATSLSSTSRPGCWPVAG